MHKTSIANSLLVSVILIGALLYVSRIVETEALVGTPKFGVNYIDMLDHEEILNTIGEVSLYQGKGTQIEAYRLFWTRAFSKDYVITAQRDNDSNFEICVSAFDIVRVDTSWAYVGSDGQCTTLDTDASEALSMAIEKPRIWLVAPVTLNTFGADGSVRSIEMLRDGTYHAATGWSPRRDTQLYRLGHALIVASDLEE